MCSQSILLAFSVSDTNPLLPTVSTELKGMECRRLLSGSSRQQSAELSSPQRMQRVSLPRRPVICGFSPVKLLPQANSCIVITKDPSHVTRVAPDQMLAEPQDLSR